MKSTFFQLGILSLGFATACGALEKPVTFATSVAPDAAIDTVSRTLASEGQAPRNVDRQANIVETEWKDTGYLYGQVHGTDATIVRRFTVTLAPSAEGSLTSVRMDAKRCARGAFVPGSSDPRGPCEEMTVIPGSMQTDLDGLGAKLRAALATK
jgi:hypothetical protein